MTERSPDILYHYTTAAGLLGILQSRQLWAAHARFLNDGRELAYGFDLIRQVLEERKKVERPDVAAALAELDSTLIGASEAIFYVACFCEKGDLLSQWRAYTGQPTGVGYSIGFYDEALKGIKGASLAKVIYDLDEQRGEIEKRLAKALAGGSFESSTDAFWSLHWELQDLVVRLKHSSFAEEQEWRVVWDIPAWKPGMGPDENLRFRADRKFVIPYMALDIPAPTEGNWREKVMRIASVRHGPAPEPTECREGLQWLLWKLGYVGVEVAGSEAPVRV